MKMSYTFQLATHQADGQVAGTLRRAARTHESYLWHGPVNACTHIQIVGDSEVIHGGKIGNASAHIRDVPAYLASQETPPKFPQMPGPLQSETSAAFFTCFSRTPQNSERGPSSPIVCPGLLYHHVLKTPCCSWPFPRAAGTKETLRTHRQLVYRRLRQQRGRFHYNFFDIRQDDNVDICWDRFCGFSRHAARGRRHLPYTHVPAVCYPVH